MGEKKLLEDDFTFIRKDKGNGYEDYWFKTNDKANKILTNRYMEMSMVGVTKVVYSKLDGVVGIHKVFPFNNYIEQVKDTELAVLLNLKVKEILGEN